MSRILTLDRGNSGLKAALFEDGKIVDKRRIDGTAGSDFRIEFEEIARRLLESGPAGISCSSVIPRWTEELVSFLGSAWRGKIVQAGPGLPLPFDLRLDDPGTLGPDRIAAACGVLAENISEAIIIDAGTAVTIDLLTAGGFEGGAIFPGHGLLLDSLSQGTAALPGIGRISGTPDLPGRRTEDAISGGVFWGVVGAVKEIAGRLADEDIPVVATGGNAGLICPYLGRDCLHLPELVLTGLDFLYRSVSS